MMGHEGMYEGTYECHLAYGLHRAPAFRCRRHGGRSVCGVCAGDVLPLDGGFKSPAMAVQRAKRGDGYDGGDPPIKSHPASLQTPQN